MYNVITNAWRGHRNPADFMVRNMLNEKQEQSRYKVPFLVVCDAFQSETTAFADLVLSETTWRAQRAPRASSSGFDDQQNQFSCIEPNV